jgi:hypothetical protein
MQCNTDPHSSFFEDHSIHSYSRVLKTAVTDSRTKIPASIYNSVTTTSGFASY